MIDIQVKTVNSMQGRQAEFVIFDFVATSNIGFMRLQNGVNVACSRAMDRMVILGDVDGILKEKIHRRWNLSNVFNYLKTRQLSKFAVKTPRNIHIPTSFARRGGSDTASAWEDERAAVSSGFVEGEVERDGKVASAIKDGDWDQANGGRT